MLGHHKNSHITALIELYPELHLEYKNFQGFFTRMCCICSCVTICILQNLPYLVHAGKKQEKEFQKVVSRVFNGHKIVFNARKVANIINPLTKSYFELDVWIPELKLGFEYQVQHQRCAFEN